MVLQHISIMPTSPLENTLEVFYGNTSKLMHFYWYLETEELISLIQTGTYFHKKVKFIYSIIIGRLAMFPLRSPMNEYTFLCRRWNQMYAESFLKCILSNHYLKNNKCLLNKFRSMNKWSD